jgi:hypothetical protein
MGIVERAIGWKRLRNVFLILASEHKQRPAYSDERWQTNTLEECDKKIATNRSVNFGRSIST